MNYYSCKKNGWVKNPTVLFYLIIHNYIPQHHGIFRIILPIIPSGRKNNAGASPLSDPPGMAQDSKKPPLGR
jgi:hypothetical protein